MELQTGGAIVWRTLPQVGRLIRRLGLVRDVAEGAVVDGVEQVAVVIDNIARRAEVVAKQPFGVPVGKLGENLVGRRSVQKPSCQRTAAVQVGPDTPVDFSGGWAQRRAGGAGPVESEARDAGRLTRKRHVFFEQIAKDIVHETNLLFNSAIGGSFNGRVKFVGVVVAEGPLVAGGDVGLAGFVAVGVVGEVVGAVGKHLVVRAQSHAGAGIVAVQIETIRLAAGLSQLPGGIILVRRGGAVVGLRRKLAGKVKGIRKVRDGPPGRVRVGNAGDVAGRVVRKKRDLTPGSDSTIKNVILLFTTQDASNRLVPLRISLPSSRFTIPKFIEPG